ncbi:hypothetical protein [Acidocella sp.]|uniref:hypothetical protein n=1 Tax=Acidocella sp. TaxID=50710 RepID=UPI00345DD607
MHIPKTAGTSMRLFLEMQYPDNEVCLDEGWHSLPSVDQLANKSLIRGHFQYNLRQVLPPEFKLLTILRDPVARTLSSLKHLQREATFAPEHALTKGRTMGQIIRIPEVMRTQRNIHAAYLCASTPPGPLLKTMRDKPYMGPTDLDAPATLDLACARLHEIDFLATVEELPLDLQSFCTHMNFHPASYFPFTNEAPNRQLDLTPEDHEILRAYNDIDLKLYEYAQKLIKLRRFEAAMKPLLANGTYQEMTGDFEIDLGGIVPGSGWHLPEREGSAVWRWTGPGDHFTLELPLSRACNHEVSMRFSAQPHFTEQDFQVAANGQSLSPTFSRHYQAHVVNFIIPRAAVEAGNGFCQLVFQAKAKIPPGDTRSLGVAVRHIGFTARDNGA